MDRKDVVKKLITILMEIQNEAGEEVDVIEETTRPIGGMKCFDSLRGVHATVLCMEAFNIEDEKVISLFEGKNPKGFPCALTVAEIADKIIAITNKG